MKRVWQTLGILIFWMSWPVWLVYFRIRPLRSRVLVRHGDTILLLRDWIGDGSWSLPGGGTHPKEAALTGACRELREETGIDIPETKLKDLGIFPQKSRGLTYRVHFFATDSTTAPGLRPRWPEILDADWFKLEKLPGLKLHPEITQVLGLDPSVRQS